jgi:D-amino-acid dehydrogenase
MAGRRVCIVGAGIVGCASAHALARDGWQVTLVDAAHAPAQGASLANGAQLSYSYVEPLATPAALRALPGWLLRPDGPVRWRPRAESAHWRWLAAFTLACRTRQVQRSTEALLALSALSRSTLHAWLAELPGAAGLAQHRRPGKLVLYRDPAARPTAERQLAWQRALGCDQRLLDARECLAAEPALAAAGAAGIAFGVWTGSEEVIDAPTLALHLARASGAQLRWGQRVEGVLRQGGRVAGLRLAGGEVLPADQVVLAAGVASARLARTAGLALPIEPIKGYSVTLQITTPALAPLASVTDQGRRMVFARLGARLRVAGFAELVGDDTAIDPRRIHALVHAAHTLFPGACDLAGPVAPWAGLRPSTPSGLPLVGATRVPGLWLNTGHGGLGLTLAAGSAVRLAQGLRQAQPERRGAQPERRGAQPEPKGSSARMDGKAGRTDILIRLPSSPRAGRR